MMGSIWKVMSLRGYGCHTRKDYLRPLAAMITMGDQVCRKTTKTQWPDSPGEEG